MERKHDPFRVNKFRYMQHLQHNRMVGCFFFGSGCCFCSILILAHEKRSIYNEKHGSCGKWWCKKCITLCAAAYREEMHHLFFTFIGSDSDLKKIPDGNAIISHGFRFSLKNYHRFNWSILILNHVFFSSLTCIVNHITWICTGFTQIFHKIRIRKLFTSASTKQWNKSSQKW